MRPNSFRDLLLAVATIAGLAAGSGAVANPTYGIAMYGEPALPPDFVSFPYVKPDAPKGGRIVLGEAGAFDSLNPFIDKGRAPYGLVPYTFESLMGRNWDEPFSLYGLLAESVETGPNREWVEFTLRPQARFSDGNPVTVEDVKWSFETLGTIGAAPYLGAWEKVAQTQITGPRSIRFTFNTDDRELPLILGLRPVLEKAQWDGHDFTRSGFDVTPIGSGPYVVADYQAGRYITLKRNPGWWGRDLPINRGKFNLDEIRYDYFGDGDVVFEAFKAGDLSSFRELNAAKWQTAYNFPRVQSGDVVKSLIPHQRPSGIAGYVMNTRRPQFQDWRVREAMITAFNYEFISQTLNAGGDPRITSYYSNSILAMQPGPATGNVRLLLVPFADQLLPGALDGYTLPKGDGTERNRANMARAVDLMAQAGWTIQNGRMKNAAGQPFNFEILLRAGASETQQTVAIFQQSLKRIGIDVGVTTVDSAQYVQRTNDYDFDMTYYIRSLSLSPGNEQMLYWGHQGVDQPGTRNWMGMNSPAAEAMIADMLAATDRDTSIAAVQALDRMLISGRYVIPIWFTPVARIAHDRHLKYPEDRVSIYGDWIGFQPDIWWWDDK